MNTRSPAFLIGAIVALGLLFSMLGRQAMLGWMDHVGELQERVDRGEIGPRDMEEFERRMAEFREEQERRRAAAEAEAEAAAARKARGSNWLAAVAMGAGGGVILAMGLVLFGLSRSGEEEPLPPLPPHPEEGLGDSSDGGAHGPQGKPAPQAEEA